MRHSPKKIALLSFLFFLVKKSFFMRTIIDTPRLQYKINSNTIFLSPNVFFYDDSKRIFSRI